MKFDLSFFDHKVNYLIPIPLPHNKLSGNIFSKLTLTDLESLKVWEFEIFSLPDFYPSTLEEKKSALLNFFKGRHFSLKHIQLDQTFFNMTKSDILFPGDILYDIENILFTVAELSLPLNKNILVNSLGEDSLNADTKCIKIKISPDKKKLFDLASWMNQNIDDTRTLIIRIDGNRKFEIVDLEYFLELLKPALFKKIEYFEEPFKNFYDSFTFSNIYKIPIAVDESLIFYKYNLINLPLDYPFILKPGLFGISESIRIINSASKLKHPVIISSTFQTYTSFAPLYYLANYSNSQNPTPLYHGLDTLKFLPEIKAL